MNGRRSHLIGYLLKNRVLRERWIRDSLGPVPGLGIGSLARSAVRDGVKAILNEVPSGDHLEMSRQSSIARFTVLSVTMTSMFAADSGVFTSLDEALARPAEARTLILNQTKLETLPDGIEGLKNLETLILHRNELKRLPPQLGNLVTLRAIYLGGSPDLDFVEAVKLLARLPHLEGVGLDDNSLRTVPANIGELKHCKRLGLSSNGLKGLPESLAALSGLETLDLYNNQFAGIPKVLTGMKIRKIYIKDSGLIGADLRLALPGVEVDESLPPELYLMLK